MQPSNANVRWRIWAGWAASILPSVMLLGSAAMKLMGGPQLAEGFNHLGWPVTLAVPLAILELTCVVVYLIPATSVLGAILVTGYLGGAVAAHVRIGETFFIQVSLGVLVWLGLWLRDGRLRALLPMRSAA